MLIEHFVKSRTDCEPARVKPICYLSLIDLLGQASAALMPTFISSLWQRMLGAVMIEIVTGRGILWGQGSVMVVDHDHGPNDRQRIRFITVCPSRHRAGKARGPNASAASSSRFLKTKSSFAMELSSPSGSGPRIERPGASRSPSEDFPSNL
jgi:hypothetical protein